MLIGENNAFQSLSPLGLGTGRLGSYGAGVTPTDVSLLLDEAEECGVNVIDTADSYGSGKCERLLAAGLKGRRDRFHIITKSGYRYGNLPRPLRGVNPFLRKGMKLMGAGQSFSPRRLRKCLELSLFRLRVDWVDTFLLHDAPASIINDDSVIALLQELVKEGKAKRFGISNSGDSEAMDAALRRVDEISLVQLPFNPATASQFGKHIEAFADAGVMVVANHVFFSGRTSLKFEKQIKAVANELGCSQRTVMLRFAAAQRGIGCVLTGTKNPSHLRENAEEVGRPLSPDQCEALLEDRIGTLPLS